jgi:hypothetical protein
MYSAEGKNPHDDSPDSITQVAVIGGKEEQKVEVRSRLF